MSMLSLCIESTNSTLDVHCYKLWCCLLTKLLSSCLQSCLVSLHCPVERVVDNVHNDLSRRTATSLVMYLPWEISRVYWYFIQKCNSKTMFRDTCFHLTTYNLETSLSASHTAYLLSILHILNLCKHRYFRSSHHSAFILPEVTNVRTWGLKKGEGVCLKQLYYFT